MPLMNQDTGESVAEEIRKRQLRQLRGETQPTSSGDTGSSIQSFSQILFMLKRLEVETASLQKQMTELSEKVPKEFAAEAAKHFDGYVERILAQRLKNTPLTSTDLTASNPTAATDPATVQAAAPKEARDRKWRRILQLLLLLLAASFLFLTGTVLLLVYKLF